MKKSSFRGTKINPDTFSRSQIKFYAILIPIALFMIIPIIFILNQAFKPMSEIFAFPPTIIARKFTLSNFKRLFNFTNSTGIPFSRYFLNSLYVVGLTLVASVFITVFSAYALTKKKFRGKTFVKNVNQFALMFVATAVSIPRFFIIAKVGVVNTWGAHILPLIVMPVCLFLMENFMINMVPDSLLEAAKIDGANDFKIIFRIVIPLVKPAIATVAILTFQAVWNSVESSTYYVDAEAMKTLAFLVNALSQQNNPLLTGVISAASLFLFVPNLIIFIVMQSQVMNTMSQSGIK